MRITLYHHAGCSQSRGTLALIREAGFEPHIVDYLHQPPDRDTLRHLAQASGLGVRGLLRSKEPLHAELWAWTGRTGTTRPCWTPCWRTRC